MKVTELREKLDLLLVTYQEIKQAVRKADSYQFERWKAGGFLVDDDIFSHYPNIGEVIDKLDGYEEDETDD